MYVVDVARMMLVQIPMEPCEIGSGGGTNGSDLCVDLATSSDINAGIGVRASRDLITFLLQQAV